MMPSNTLNTVLTLALLLIGAYAAVRWVLPWLLPFFIAWGIAALLEPLVARLHRRGLGRSLAAGLCLIGALGIAAGALWLLVRRLSAELSALTARAPEILSEVLLTVDEWKQRLSGWMARTPEGLRQWLDRAAAGAEESLTHLPAQLSARLIGAMPALAAAAPSALLFAVTAVIGAYFISASYPELLHLAAAWLPDRFLCRARLLRRNLRRTLGRWLRAQIMMLAVTFAALTAAFLMLGLNYALLLALVTSVIDALPVLGAGTVLLPWAGYALLTGNMPLGIGLAITYAAVTVLHQSVQAKLLGDQLGLHPLATLVSIYVGWKVWGVMGMVTFPILAISLKQAADGTVLRRPGKKTEYE